MQLKLICARVYATDDQYGDVPRQRPPGAPLTFVDFPRAGEEITVDLGAVPGEIVEANRVRRAIGAAMLGACGGGGETLTLQERVDRASAERRGSELEERNWYVTLALSRVIDVPADEVADVDFAFLTEPFRVADDFTAYATPHLDVVATIASTIIDPRAFGEVVLKDRVLLFAVGACRDHQERRRQQHRDRCPFHLNPPACLEKVHRSAPEGSRCSGARRPRERQKSLGSANRGERAAVDTKREFMERAQEWIVSFPIRSS
jgi:hypothetical protein